MFRVARCTLVAASITLTLVACHDAAAPPHAGPALAAPPTMSLQANGPFVLHQVPPASTDPDIESEGKWLSDHFVWLYPGAERAEKLFVHLPGGANPIQVPASFQFLAGEAARLGYHVIVLDRKSTRLNSSHGYISYAVFCLKKKKTTLYYVHSKTHPDPL